MSTFFFFLKDWRVQAVSQEQREQRREEAPGLGVVSRVKAEKGQVWPVSCANESQPSISLMSKKNCLFESPRRVQVESEPDLEMDLAPTHCDLGNVTCPHLTTVSFFISKMGTLDRTVPGVLQLWDPGSLNCPPSRPAPWVRVNTYGPVNMRLFMPDVAVRWLWSMGCKSTLTCAQKQSPFQLLISPPFSPVSTQFLFWPLSPFTLLFVWFMF